MSTAQRDAEQRFECFDCGAVFKDRRAYGRHLNSCAPHQERIAQRRQDERDADIEGKAIILHGSLPDHLQDDMLPFCRTLVEMFND